MVDKWLASFPQNVLGSMICFGVLVRNLHVPHALTQLFYGCYGLCDSQCFILLEWPLDKKKMELAGTRLTGAFVN